MNWYIVGMTNQITKKLIFLLNIVNLQSLFEDPMYVYKLMLNSIVSLIIKFIFKL